MSFQIVFKSKLFGAESTLERPQFFVEGLKMPFKILAGVELLVAEVTFGLVIAVVDGLHVLVQMTFEFKMHEAFFTLELRIHCCRRR